MKKLSLKQMAAFVLSMIMVLPSQPIFAMTDSVYESEASATYQQSSDSQEAAEESTSKQLSDSQATSTDSAYDSEESTTSKRSSYSRAGRAQSVNKGWEEVAPLGSSAVKVSFYITNGTTLDDSASVEDFYIALGNDNDIVEVQAVSPEAGIATLSFTNSASGREYTLVKYTGEGDLTAAYCSANWWYDATGQLTKPEDFGNYTFDKSNPSEMKAVKKAQGSASLSAKVAANSKLGDRKFQFRLYKSDFLLQTSGAVGQGETAAFLEITYTGDDIGDHTYEIRQVIPEGATAANNYTLEGVTYDTSVKTVKVTVSIGSNNALKISYNENDSLDVPEFTNTYAAEEVEGEIEVLKVVNGREWTDADEFQFLLSPVTDGAPMPELAVGESQYKATITKDTANHTASFGKIVFQNEGSYKYIVTEVREGATPEGVTYDAAEKLVTIDVKDNGIGNLTMENKTVLFTMTVADPEDVPEEKQEPEEKQSAEEHKTTGTDIETVSSNAEKYVFNVGSSDTSYVVVANTKADISAAFDNIKSSSDYVATAKHRYRCKNKRIAKVSKEGILTPKKTGEVDIIVQQKVKGEGWKQVGDNIHFYVQKPEMKKKKESVNLSVGSLDAHQFLSKTTFSPTKWISTNPEVATVDGSTGIITLHSTGSTYIIARYGNPKTGSNKKYKIKLKVKADK